MSIFKKRDTGEVQTIAAPAPERVAQQAVVEQKQPPRPAPPAVSPALAAQPHGTPPGVVPPPAAPMYSMRVPELPPRTETDVHATPEKVTAARDTQHAIPTSAEPGVRAAALRARATPTASTVRRPPQQAIQMPRRSTTTRAYQPFDPGAAAQAGLLKLAWRWQEAGSPIRAIHAYMALLARHPGTPAADAAVADLVELSDKLAEQGLFQLALSIYEELEHLDQLCEDA